MTTPMDAHPRSETGPRPTSTGGTSAASGGTSNGSGGTSNGSGGTSSASGGASSAIVPVSDAGSDSATSRSVGIVVPPVSVPAGAEVFGCYHARLPSDVEVHATAITSTAPLINELMMFRVADDAKSGVLEPMSCSAPSGAEWVYGAWARDSTLRMPAGVAHTLGAQQPLLVDLHWLNGGGASGMSNVTIELQTRDGTFASPAAAVSFNTSVSVPAGGTATASGDCTLPPGAQLFSMTTHTNRLATRVTVSRKLAGGQLGERLVETTDYAHPSLATWSSAPFPSLGPGEALHYSCEYANPGTSTVTLGASALTNEMCMTISYFFPASSRASCH